MPRKTKEEIEAEAKKEKVAEDVPQQQQAGIIEVPINLELLNNKLNYVITKLDIIYNSLFKVK